MERTNFIEKLLEVIAEEVIEHGHMSDVPIPQDLGTLRWTGWKQRLEEVYPHGQIIWAIDHDPESPRHFFYVDLPSMQHGKVRNGYRFNIEQNEKSHIFSQFTGVLEIREWFKEGFALLIDDVLNELPRLLEKPLQK